MVAASATPPASPTDGEACNGQLWQPDAEPTADPADDDPITPELLDDANMYILVCQFAYHPVKDTKLKQYLQDKWNLHLVHIHNDGTKELRYIVMRQDPPPPKLAAGEEPEQQQQQQQGDEAPPQQKPLRYIIGFRGLKHSFDFADLRPFVEPSPTSKNRKHFMIYTELVPAPEALGVPSGQVHQGLLEYFMRLSVTIPEALQDWLLDCESIPLTACGFSMGCLLSAYTTLFLHNYVRQQGKEAAELNVFNFCAPKLGNLELVTALHRQTKSFYSVHMHGDPVASFPDREGYVLGGSIVLVKENDYAATMPPPVRKWKAELISHRDGPLNPDIVTLEQMRVGLEGTALPSFSAIQSCKKYHRMDMMKEVCASPPLRRAEVELLRREMEKRKQERLQVINNGKPAEGAAEESLECFLCPARKGESRACWS